MSHIFNKCLMADTVCVNQEV